MSNGEFAGLRRLVWGLTALFGLAIGGQTTVFSMVMSASATNTRDKIDGQQDLFDSKLETISETIDGNHRELKAEFASQRSDMRRLERHISPVISNGHGDTMSGHKNERDVGLMTPEEYQAKWDSIFDMLETDPKGALLEMYRYGFKIAATGAHESVEQRLEVGMILGKARNWPEDVMAWIESERELLRAHRTKPGKKYDSRTIKEPEYEIANKGGGR